MKKNTIPIKLIDDCLPQTQCRECGFQGCLPYAQAIQSGLDTIDKCPPGGLHTLQQLANLLDIDANPYIESVKQQTRHAQVAFIDEAACIGCTKCIQACPVDAIVGAAKMMHTVIEDHCTGCELCIEPCPVDCIHLGAMAPKSIIQQKQFANISRQRYQQHQARQVRLEQERHLKHQRAKQKAHKKYIEAAIARVQQKKARAP